MLKKDERKEIQVTIKSRRRESCLEKKFFGRIANETRRLVRKDFYELDVGRLIEHNKALKSLQNGAKQQIIG